LKDLAAMLHPYTREGVYGKYFESDATIDFSSDFIVLELEELKAKKDLQTVVLLIMMYRITREMYFSRERKKIVIIDEAWDLLSGGATAEFIEAGYRRARKYKGSFMSATQGVDDYYRNPAAKAALDNSDWMFLLRTKAGINRDDGQARPAHDGRCDETSLAVVAHRTWCVFGDLHPLASGQRHRPVDRRSAQPAAVQQPRRGFQRHQRQARHRPQRLAGDR
jgi:hypothetical protein